MKILSKSVMPVPWSTPHSPHLGGIGIGIHGRPVGRRVAVSDEPFRFIGDITQCEAPKIANLVYNSNNYGLWYL